MDKALDYISFNARLLTTFAAVQKAQVFEKGEVLFRENDSPDGVHILLSGDVDLLFANRYEQAPLHFAVAGQILGLSSIVSGRLHEYTAVAAGSVLTGFVHRETFFRVLHEQPERWFDVLQVLSNDLGSCYERVKELATTGTLRNPRERAGARP